MKVNRNVFLNCLERVFPAVDKNSLFEEYQNFNFCGKKVLTTNGSIWMETVLPEGLNWEASILADPLCSLLKKIAEEEVSLEIKNGKLCIETPTLSGNFAVRPPRTIKLPSIGEKALAVKGEQLNDLISGLDFCRYGVSKDMTIGAYCGVKVREETVWGCDRYRVLSWNLSFKLEGLDFCLPRKVVNLLILERSNLQQLSFTPGKNFGGIIEVILSDGTVMVASCLEGEYTDLNRFFPGVGILAEEVKLDEKFPEILGRHLVVLSDVPNEDKAVEFRVSNQSVTTISKRFVVSGSQDLARSLTEVSGLSAVREGNNFEFSVHPLLLRDAFGICSWTFKYFPDKSVVLFEGEKFKYLVKVRQPNG